MTKYVEIYKLEKDGTQRKIAACYLYPGSSKVECKGEKWLVSALSNKGIRNYLQGKKEKVFPKDGIKFLENLKNHFKSGYLNATDVLTSDE